MVNILSSGGLDNPVRAVFGFSSVLRQVVSTVHDEIRISGEEYKTTVCDQPDMSEEQADGGEEGNVTQNVNVKSSRKRVARR